MIEHRYRERERFLRQQKRSAIRALRAERLPFKKSVPFGTLFLNLVQVKGLEFDSASIVFIPSLL